jgi:hypothetical protein
MFILRDLPGILNEVLLRLESDGEGWNPRVEGRPSNAAAFSRTLGSTEFGDSHIAKKC